MHGLAMRGQPRERPIDFRPDYAAMRRAGIVFAGLGGQRCAGSMRFADSSGLGNHGTLMNMDPATDWVCDNTLGRWWTDYDGSNDFVGGLTYCGYPLTVAAWIYSADWGTATRRRGIMSAYNGASIRWNFCHNSAVGTADGALRVFDDSGTIIVGGITTSSTFETSTLYHLAYVLDDGKLVTPYLNGVVNGTPKTLSKTPGAGASVGYVGSGEAKASCRISDPLCFNRALSPSEIAALADPSNVMLSLGRGSPPLLLPPRRRLWGAAVAGDADYSAARRRRILCGSS